MINKENRLVTQAYYMIIEGTKDKDIVSKLNDWYKKNKKDILDSKKVEKSINKIKDIIQQDEENLLLMDGITEQFLILSKQIENEKASEELADILQKI